MNNYIINNDTIAIIGIGNNSSKIIEKNKSFFLNQSCKKIIEDSCMFYGSSYKGRVDSSSYILKSNYKVPILISDENIKVFFPTISPDSSICMWISIMEIEREEIIDNLVNITFKNKERLVTNLSKYSIENQMFKAFILASVMYSRKMLKN